MRDYPANDAMPLFLALAQLSAGRPAEALALAFDVVLATSSSPEIERYRRALGSTATNCAAWRPISRAQARNRRFPPPNRYTRGMHRPLRICYAGTYERRYPRNRLVIAACARLERRLKRRMRRSSSGSPTRLASEDSV